MARGEDGTEFRPSDTDYGSAEEAELDLDEVQENYPCAKLFIVPLKDRAYYERLHQDRYERDEQDLY